MHWLSPTANVQYYLQKRVVLEKDTVANELLTNNFSLYFLEYFFLANCFRMTSA